MQDLTEGKDELLLINSRVPRGSGSDLYKKKQNWILNTDQDQKLLISCQIGQREDGLITFSIPEFPEAMDLDPTSEKTRIRS